MYQYLKFFFKKIDVLYMFKAVDPNLKSTKYLTTGGDISNEIQYEIGKEIRIKGNRLSIHGSGEGLHGCKKLSSVLSYRNSFRTYKGNIHVDFRYICCKVGEICLTERFSKEDCIITESCIPLFEVDMSKINYLIQNKKNKDYDNVKIDEIANKQLTEYLNSIKENF